MERNIPKQTVSKHPNFVTENEEYFQIHPHYEVLRAVSEDACGTLYRGRSILDDKPVGIKLFTKRVSPVRDQRISEELSRVNIIGITEVLMAQSGNPFAVMDIPQGQSLNAIISKQGQLPVVVAVNIALAVSLIVRALHMHDKTHGHLNAHNVLLKKQKAGGLDTRIVFHELHGIKSQFNIPGFLSPELIVQNDTLSPNDDYWAVAVLLYQMIFGEGPFVGGTRDKIIERILTEPIVLPDSFEQQYPALAAYLCTALAQDPRERFSSGRDMYAALKAVLTDLRHHPDGNNHVFIRESAPSPAKPPPLPSPKKNVPADAVITRSMPAVSEDDIVKAMEVTDEDSDIEYKRLTPTTLPAPPSNSALVLSTKEQLNSALPNMDSIQLTHKNHYQLSRSKRRLLWGAALLTILLTVGVAAFVLRATEKSPHPQNNPQKDIAGGVQATLPPTTQHDRPVAATALDDEKKVTPSPQSLPKMIVITLQNLPPKAYATLDGKPTDFPATVPKSDAPIALQVFIGQQAGQQAGKRAGKRAIFSSTVTPTENQTVSVAPLKTKWHRKNKKKKPSRVANSSGTETQGRAKGSLSSNPHQLKTNPFATGESK